MPKPTIPSLPPAENTRGIEVKLFENATHLKNIHEAMTSEIRELTKLDTKLVSINEQLSQHHGDLRSIQVNITDLLGSFREVGGAISGQARHFQGMDVKLGELKESFGVVGRTLSEQHVRLGEIRSVLSTQVERFESLNTTILQHGGKFDLMNSTLGNQLEVLGSLKDSFANLSQQTAGELETLGKVTESLTLNQTTLREMTGILSAQDGNLMGIKAGFEVQNSTLAELGSALNAQAGSLENLGTVIEGISTESSAFAPVTAFSQGEAVSELQERLGSLGYSVPNHEKESAVLGEGTKDALLQFQKQSGIPASGTYNATTKATMDDAVKGNRIVEGRVAFEDGTLAPGVELKIYSIGLKEQRGSEIGTCKTDSKGFYSLAYNTSSSGKNIEIVAIQKGGTEVLLTNPICGLSQCTELNLVAPGEASRLYDAHDSEYSWLRENLISEIGESCELSDLQENNTKKDFTVLHNITGWDAKFITLCSTANKLSKETGMPEEALYGLLRAGMPSGLDYLANSSLDNIDEALIKVSKAGVISLSDEEIEKAKTAFKTFALDRTGLARAPGAVSTHQEVVNTATWLTRQERNELDNLVFEGVSGSDIWKKAKDELRISPVKIDALKLQGKLGYLTQNNASLMKTVQTDIAGNDLSKLVELGYHRASAWVEKLTTTASDPDSLLELVPEVYRGVSDGQKSLQAYAEDMARNVRIGFPTRVIAAELEAEDGTITLGAGKAQLNTPVSKFLKEASSRGFELGNKPISRFLSEYSSQEMFGDSLTEEQLPVALEQVKRVQRLYMVTPDSDSLGSALQCGFESASDIAGFTREDFLKLFASQFKSPAVADLVFRRATQVKSLAYSFFGIVKHLESTPPIFAVSSSSEKKSKVIGNLLKQYPTMEMLFGSMDYCECDHAKSVLSPAAYLVDLLKLLDPSEESWARTMEDWKNRHKDAPYPFDTKNEHNRYTDWLAENPGATKIDMGTTPYKILQKRRPDLAYLKLTPENTYTAMPYIDIVNEILESFIANNGPSESCTFDTGDSTSEELLAHPENTESAAYDILNSKTYPVGLPFDLWLETVRKLLEHSDISLSEVLGMFCGDKMFPTDEEPDALCKSMVLSEFIGLSPAEYDLFTNQERHLKWYELYGYDDTTSALTAMAASEEANGICAKVLARKLGLTYKEFNSFIELGCFDRILPGTTRPILKYPSSGCDFGAVILKFPENTDGESKAMALLVMNLFVRLWRKLNISMEEMSDSLQAFLPSDLLQLGKLCNETANKLSIAFRTTLVYLSNSKKIWKYCGDNRQSFVRLLPFWSDISIEGKHSLFNQLFIKGNDPESRELFENIRVSDSSTTLPVIKDCEAAIQGTLELDSSDIAQILADVGKTPGTEKVSLSILSLIYRHSALAEWLDLTIPQLISLKVSSGLDPFRKIVESPLSVIGEDVTQETLSFIELVRSIDESDFKVVDIDYLLRHDFDPIGEYRYDEEALQKLIINLNAGLVAIDESLEIPDNDSEPADDLVLRWSSHLVTANVAEKLLGYINGSIEDGGSQFFEEELAGLIRYDFLFSTSTDCETAVQRKHKVLEKFQPIIRTKLAHNFIFERLALEFDCDWLLVETLISDPGPMKAIHSQSKALLVTFLRAGETDLTGGLDDASNPTEEQEELLADIRAAHIRLGKVLQIVHCTGLSNKEIGVLLNPALQANCLLDPNSIPVEKVSSSPSTTLMESLMTVLKYSQLKRVFSKQSDDLLRIYETEELDNKTELLAELMRRAKETIEDCINALGLTNGDLMHPVKLGLLYDMLVISSKLGVSPSTLSILARMVSLRTPQNERASIARNLKDMVRSRYSRSSWLQVAKSVFHEIRQLKRDALVAYIKHLRSFDSTEQMFEFFLIDPGMEPVVQTSRLRLAISSIQLFIQRCLLNLEVEVRSSVINSKHWGWMKQYRVWEANRKIFLYPENWLEPEFRDDKSHLFQELEGALMEGELTQDCVEAAFYRYLRNFEEISKLEIVSIHCEENAIDQSSNKVHVLGRTNTNPPKYFYRKNSHRMWTPWLPVPLEIQGNHVILVKHRGRIGVFWVNFLEVPEESTTNSDLTAMEAANYNTISSLKPQRRIKVQLNWSEYYLGEWTDPNVTGFEAPHRIMAKSEFDVTKDVFIHATKEIDEKSGEELAIKIHLRFDNAVVDPPASTSTGSIGSIASNHTVESIFSDSLSVHQTIETQYYLIASSSMVESVNRARGTTVPIKNSVAFRVVSRSLPVALEIGENPEKPPYSSLTDKRDTRHLGKNKLSVEYIEKIVTRERDEPVKHYKTADILGKCGIYEVVVSSTPVKLPPKFGALLSPFFYQDFNNTFFVEPNLVETEITGWEDWIPRIGFLEPPQLDESWVDHIKVGIQWPRLMRIDEVMDIDFGKSWEDFITPFAKYGFTEKLDWVANPSTVLQVGDIIVDNCGGISDSVVGINAGLESSLDIADAVVENLTANGMNVVGDLGVSAFTAVKISGVTIGRVRR